MSSDATDNTMRAEFEVAMRSGGFEFGDDDLQWFDGDFGPSFDKGARFQMYCDSEMQCRWEGWQAARADTARQVAELEARSAKSEEQVQNALSWRDMIDRNRSRLTDMERERIRADEREACARCAETVPIWEAAKWIRKRTDMFAAEIQKTDAQ